MMVVTHAWRSTHRRRPCGHPALNHGIVECITDASAAHAVLRRVRAIPPGFVRSYGDVSPGAPRFAGTVLHTCEDPRVPWHRVVRADGSLAKGGRQRRLLEAEGVPFCGDRVDVRVARILE